VPNSITLTGSGLAPNQFGAGQHNGIWSLACSEPVRSQLRTSLEQATVMEFGFYCIRKFTVSLRTIMQCNVSVAL